MVMVSTEGINSPERAVSMGLERRARGETHGEVAQEGFGWCWPWGRWQDFPVWASSTSALGSMRAKVISSSVSFIGMKQRPPCQALTWPPLWAKKLRNVSSGSSSKPPTPHCSKVSLVAGHLWMCPPPQPWPGNEISSTHSSFQFTCNLLPRNNFF